jgi:hypothetical protein
VGRLRFATVRHRCVPAAFQRSSPEEPTAAFGHTSFVERHSPVTTASSSSSAARWARVPGDRAPPLDIDRRRPAPSSRAGSGAGRGYDRDPHDGIRGSGCPG